MIHQQCEKKTTAVLRPGPAWIAVALTILFFSVSLALGQTETSERKSVFDLKLPEIESALGADDWKNVKDILQGIVAQQPGSDACGIESPLRFLYGHASLATGANTEAVFYFYCPCDSFGLRAWKAWTGKLIDDHKGSVSASMHYLTGDALARNSELREAITEFDAALAIDPAYVLALNARGVAKWVLFEQDSSLTEYELGAVEDLIAASKAAPDFADAWANRGLVGLRDFSALDRAKNMFDKAMSIDSTYWLALNGKAVSAGAAGEYWEFGKTIDHLMDKAPNTPYVQINAAPSGDKRVSPGARGVQQNIFNNYVNPTLDAVSGGPIGGAVYVIKVLQKVGSLSSEIMEKNLTLHGGNIGNTTADFLRDMRGGVFMFVKDGENLAVAENGSPRLAGTWFTLNYPLAAVEPDLEE